MAAGMEVNINIDRCGDNSPHTRRVWYPFSRPSPQRYFSCIKNMATRLPEQPEYRVPGSFRIQIVTFKKTSVEKHHARFFHSLSQINYTKLNGLCLDVLVRQRF